MARYVVVALLASAPITFLYDDPSKALAKIRTLQRQAIEFQLKDVSGADIALSELEKLARD